MKKFFCFFIVVCFCFFAFGCNKNVSEKTVKCKLTVEYQNQKIFGSVTYSNFESCINGGTVAFNLYPNKIFDSDNAITILSVYQNGNSCEFIQTGEKREYLQVKATSNEILINFETQVFNGNKRLASFEGGANLSYFFPHLVPLINSGEFAFYNYSTFGDAFFDPFCDYEVSLTVPSENAVACGATPTFCNVNGETTTYGYLLNGAKTFALCINKNYAVVSKKWGNKCVNYYYYNDDNPEKLLDITIKALEFFTEKIGDVAFNTLTVAKTPFDKGGMEYPAFCMISDGISNEEYYFSTVHEIAHQYFPISVDFNQCESAFLDEGFAEYLAMKFLQKTDNKQFLERLFLINASAEAFEKAVKSGKTNFKSSAFRSLNEFSCEYEYVSVVYRKAFLTFLNAEKAIGEKAFFKGVRKFLKKYGGKNATFEQFCDCFALNEKTIRQTFFKTLA